MLSSLSWVSGFSRKVTAAALLAGCVSWPALAGGGVSASAEWPENGVGQRVFPETVEQMFVETAKDGTSHAWVIKSSGAPATKAMDFFTGRISDVKVSLSSDGEQWAEFTDAGGRTHKANTKFKNLVSSPMKIAGAVFGEDTFALNGTDDRCAVSLDASRGSVSGKAGGRKYLVHHGLPSGASCSSGTLGSAVTSVLDLGDGSVLVSGGCFVFRVKAEDLSPVGAAPSLRVVDEGALNKAKAAFDPKTEKDATGYLIKALNIPADAAHSCP